jgi:hypothetical protein
MDNSKGIMLTELLNVAAADQFISCTKHYVVYVDVYGTEHLDVSWMEVW